LQKKGEIAKKQRKEKIKGGKSLGASKIMTGEWKWWGAIKKEKTGKHGGKREGRGKRMQGSVP